MDSKVSEWLLQNRPSRETWRLLLGELSPQGDKNVSSATFPAFQAVLEKQTNNPQLEGRLGGEKM